MSNKKAGIAVEEISGILMFMFLAVLGLLFFFGFMVGKTATDYEKLAFSNNEIKANRDLNFFLEIPYDEERKVSDVIVEAYLARDYSETYELGILEYFSNKYSNWRLNIGDKYDPFQSYDLEASIDYIEVYVKLPVKKESTDLEFVDVKLRIY